MNDGPMEDDAPHPAAVPLEYRSPALPPPGTVRDAFRGFICGVLVTAVSGCFVALRSYQPMRVAPTTAGGLTLVKPPPLRWPAWLFVLLLVGAACGAVAMWRTKSRNTFYLGMLIGVGATSLCEGLCFAGQ